MILSAAERKMHLPVPPVARLVAVFGMVLQIWVPAAADGIVAFQPFAQVVVRTSFAPISSMAA